MAAHTKAKKHTIQHGGVDLSKEFNEFIKKSEKDNVVAHSYWGHSFFQNLRPTIFLCAMPSASNLLNHTPKIPFFSGFLYLPSSLQ